MKMIKWYVSTLNPATKAVSKRKMLSFISIPDKSTSIFKLTAKATTSVIGIHFMPSTVFYSTHTHSPSSIPSFNLIY